MKRNNSLCKLIRYNKGSSNRNNFFCRLTTYDLRVTIFILLFLILPTRNDSQVVTRLGLNPERIYRMSIPSNVHWTDSGFDVKANQEIFFNAVGIISLQQGNPMAYFGPEGYELKTVQQPIRDENLGALIGRIVLLISVEVDEETGKETRHEIIKEFFIGKRNRVIIPIDGQLFLGINELVVADNSGELRVEFQLVSR